MSPERYRSLLTGFPNGRQNSPRGERWFVSMRKMVRPAGIEPPTLSLEVRC